MVVRVELRGKNLRTARVTGVSQRFIQRRDVSQISLILSKWVRS